MIIGQGGWLRLGVGGEQQEGRPVTAQLGQQVAQQVGPGVGGQIQTLDPQDKWALAGDGAHWIEQRPWVILHLGGQVAEEGGDLRGQAHPGGAGQGGGRRPGGSDLRLQGGHLGRQQMILGPKGGALRLAQARGRPEAQGQLGRAPLLGVGPHGAGQGGPPVARPPGDDRHLALAPLAGLLEQVAQLDQVAAAPDQRFGGREQVGQREGRGGIEAGWLLGRVGYPELPRDQAHEQRRAPPVRRGAHGGASGGHGPVDLPVALDLSHHAGDEVKRGG